MLRGILVPLDATAASAAPQQLALRITAPTAVGIGGMAYQEHRDQVKIGEARALLARLESTFQQSCEESGAAWQVIEAEGKPAKAD